MRVEINSGLGLGPGGREMHKCKIKKDLVGALDPADTDLAGQKG